VENEVSELMKMMEPSYLLESGDVGAKARRLLLAAGFIVACANGVVVRAEVEALASVVGAQMSPDEIGQMFSRPIPEVRELAQSLMKDLNALLTGVQKLQLVRDLIIISCADGTFDQAEAQCLHWICEGLSVDPRFIEQVLASARRGVD
jgi:tellurite resistance protein